jgi:tetratricopeptide (TPR) repeat protein
LSRQQTLHAALQWSYQNLTANEQRMLRRLSVFADGCTLEAAAAVAGDDGDEVAVLEAIERLVDHALIVVDLLAAAAPRYRMLETVRQFAQERLQDSGEGDAMRERHLAFFLAYAKAAAPELLGEDVVQWSARLDAEQSNLLAAHGWCSAAVDGATQGLELATALRNYWLNRGLFSLGRQLYEEALARPGAEPRSLARAGALFSLAQHHYHQWQVREMRALAEQALAIAREHDDDPWLFRCLLISAVALAWAGEPARALACADETIAVAGRIGGRDTTPVAAALGAKGEVLRAQGRFADALEAQEAALSAHGNQCNVNLPARLRDVARAAIALGRLERARETLVQAMQVLSELGMRHYASWYIQVVSRLAAAGADWSVAARLQGAADAIIDTRGGVRHGQDDQISAELRERTKTRLGAQVYARAYAGGYGLTLDQAFDETVAWLDGAH